MIPGGFKGIKHLHKHRIITRRDITLEERDRAIIEYIQQNPRKGIPHPFMSELWKDDGFYLKNIEARSNTLSVEQVKRIRELYELGRSVSVITEEVGARNETQVKNVVSGRTFGRIR